MRRMLEMVARFFLTLMGLLLAMFVMRLVVGQAARHPRTSPGVVAHRDKAGRRVTANGGRLS